MNEQFGNENEGDLFNLNIIPIAPTEDHFLNIPEIMPEGSFLENYLPD